MAKRAPIHPGEILKEEFLDELDVTAYALSKAAGMPRSRLSHIINGERAISAETALRLGQYFGNSAEFWMNLQSRYDLEVASDRYGRRIAQEVPMMEMAVT